MVLKVKYKLLTEGCQPITADSGNTFYLAVAKNMTFKRPKVMQEGIENPDIKIDFHSEAVPLGIAIELPKGIVAEIRPRVSSFRKWRIVQSNSTSLIQTTTNLDTELSAPLVALGTSHIKKGDRLFEMEFKLAQNATIWQRFKWLFVNKIKFVRVEGGK